MSISPGGAGTFDRLEPHISAATAPLIVAVAPNGARRTRADHPAIPVTAAEVARVAASCREAGASLLHLHVRDKDGGHLLDAEAYRTAIAAVRDEAGPDLVIQITSEAVGRYTAAEQRAVVRDTMPEAVSLALRELVAEDESDLPETAAFYRQLHRAGVMVQHILYDSMDVERFDDLRRRGVIPGSRCDVLFVLGRYAASQRSDPWDLLPFLDSWDGADGDTWSVCAFGPREGACVSAAACFGGHARVGFENNLLRPDGSPADGNEAPVVAAVLAGRAIGRAAASADDVRRLMAPG